MKRLSILASAVSLSCLVSACGAMSSMNRMDASTSKMSATTDQMNSNTSFMKDSTSDMSNTTKGMAATTSEMAATTKGMAATTADMAVTTGKMAGELAFTYLDMRVGNTRASRQDSLKAMADSQEPGTKLAYASEYFAAAEFQYWKPGNESTGDLDDMKNVAVQEFFLKIQEYIGKSRDVSPMAKDDKTENLYAMAAAMHYVNLAQMSALRRNPEMKLTSMLSMIEEGLSAKADVEAGKVEENTLPNYQVEVLRNEEIATYILKVRHNYLKAIALSYSASLKDGSDYSNDPNSEAMKTITCLKHISVKDGVCTAPLTWTATYDLRNSSELNYIAGMLKAAGETQSFLKTLGVDPQIDQASIMMLKLMKYDGSKATSPAILKAYTRITAALAFVLAKP